MSENNAIDIPTIEALKEIMGDAFSVLLPTFTDETGKLVHSLSELHKQNDIEVFTRNAHSIKSSSANLGAAKLSTLAGELEAQGKSGDIANAPTIIERLTKEFELACNELKRLY